MISPTSTKPDDAPMEKQKPITQGDLVTSTSTKHDYASMPEFLWYEAVLQLIHSLSPRQHV